MSFNKLNTLPTTYVFIVVSSLQLNIYDTFCIGIMISLPVHVFPSPEYPALHEQLYDPLMLLHTALTSHL